MRHVTTTNRYRLPLILIILSFITSWNQYAIAQTEKHRILILGDSLSAARGIDENDGWVELLRQKLATEEIANEVINASVSGETSDGGLLRLPKLLQQHAPHLVVIELGGNDGLRGLSTKTLNQNLQTMVELSQQVSAEVLLLGMKIPPNYGARYGRLFEQSYADIASKHQVAFVPFFLENVALDASLMQRDQIHPTAEAQAIMLENIWGELSGLLKK